MTTTAPPVLYEPPVPEQRPPAELRRRRAAGAREIALLTVLYVAYAAARTVADDALAPAQQVGRRILGIEALMSIDIESAASSWLVGVPALALLACWFYAAMHYVVTPAVLLWVFRRHPHRYPTARSVLVVGSAVGLVVFAALPTAPPRLLPGFVDVMAHYSGYGWWGQAASAPDGLAEWSNQLAAMPSLHVGWSLWCAWAVMPLLRRRSLRLLAVAYPLTTSVVVIGTANHYVLDVLAGLLVIAVPAALAAVLAAARSGTDVRPALWSRIVGAIPVRSRS